MNRLLTRTDALGRGDSRSYDTNGNLTKFVDRRGKTSMFAYDTLNRLVTETYSDATVTRAWAAGRLTQAADSASGTFGFSYDAAGRLLSSTSPYGTVDYTYDARSAVVSRQVVGQPVLTYAYDAAGNLISAAMPQASASMAYDADNRPSTMSRLNGVSSAFTYDAAGRLLSLAHAKGSTGIDNEAYTYDAVGNRISHATSIGQSLITQPVASASYDASNQQTQFGSTTNSFDATGNLVTGGGSTLTWDGRGRLRSLVTGTGQTTNFTYDFAGNLISQADAGSSLNLTKYFILDDLTNVSYETASDGSTYSALAGRSLDGQLAIIQSNAQVQYGLTDAINSTIATVDQSAAVKSQFFYDAYGQTTATGSYPFQFTGRTPAAASLQYNRARYFSPLGGRFTSEDPLGPISGTNLFAYGGDNPAGNTDPSGLLSFGGSVYDVVGGGFNVAFTANGLSICVELGAGLGDSIDEDPFGGLADDSVTVFGEITGGIGPISGTLGGEIDSCGYHGKAQACLGPFCVGDSVTLDGKPKELGKNVKQLVNPKGAWKASLEGKIGVRVCKKFSW
jgi:RHS repeat-associated protein